jgi:hypothetical protein
MKRLEELVGKHICYGNRDGGFCWGRIKAAVKVNTAKGEQDAFIVSDRKTCTGRTASIQNHDRDTLLLVNMIDLDNDVVDKEDLFKEFTDDELFLLIMDGFDNLSGHGNIGLGLKNMITARQFSGEIVKDELAGRLDMKEQEEKPEVNLMGQVVC